MLDVVPIWGLFLLTILVVTVSIEAGYRLGRLRGVDSEEEKEAPVGAIVGATLALLGFILAFTFSLSFTRYDAKREILVEEANSIGTTYLRAGVLPNNRGISIRKYLSEYVNERLEVVKTKDIEKVLQRSDELHRQLWKETEAVGKEHPNSIVVGLFIQSMNETIDLHAKRAFVSLQNRIPAGIWGVLYLVTCLTMLGVGYYEGLTHSKRSRSLVILVVAFASILALIIDLDRPQEGFLRVSQQTMMDLRTMIQNTP